MLMAARVLRKAQKARKAGKETAAVSGLPAP
jgi:hypothetical protein